MKFLLLALLVALCGCGSPGSQKYEVRYPSPLDGAANSPSSWHKGHVTVYAYSDNFFLDDGSLVKFFFTGGTKPELQTGQRGILYVSVPSYDEHDDDNTYYFQKFVPDKP